MSFNEAFNGESTKETNEESNEENEEGFSLSMPMMVHLIHNINQ